MIRFFRHYVPASLLLLVMVEALMLGASIYLGVSVRSFDVGFPTPSSALLPKAVVFALTMLLVMTALGLYDWDGSGGLRAILVRVVAAFAIGYVAVSQVFSLVPSLALGRGTFIVSFLVAAGGILLTRLLFVRWTNLEALKKRVMVLGTGSRAARVEKLVRDNPGNGVHIVGYFPLGGAHHFVEHARILPDEASILEIVEKYKIDEIVLAVRDRRGGALPVDALLECKLLGINVMELSSFFERENGQVQLDSLNASWMILSEGFHQGVLRDTVKRVFDLVVSVLILALALPVMVLAALAIKLETSGPVLYRQERMGQHGKPFTILKFRSMRADAEPDGTPKWAGADDHRATRIGRLIRKVRIDELPQLFNVFRGDMSFVGPRPERPFFVSDLARQIPYYGCRHSVKPGITGWAQVRYPYGANVQDALEKLQYDLYYVKNHSLFLDLMILFQTVQVVLSGKGAR